MKECFLPMIRNKARMSALTLLLNKELEFLAVEIWQGRKLKGRQIVNK